MLFAKGIQPASSGGGDGPTFTLAGVPDFSSIGPGQYVMNLAYTPTSEAGTFDPYPPTYDPPVTDMLFVNTMGLNYFGYPDIALVSLSAEITDGTISDQFSLTEYIDSVVINGVPIPGAIVESGGEIAFLATNPDVPSYVPGVETYITLEVTLSEIPDLPAGWTYTNTGA